MRFIFIRYCCCCCCSFPQSIHSQHVIWWLPIFYFVFAVGWLPEKLNNFSFFLFHHHHKCYFPSTLMCMANCLDIFFGKHVQFFSQKKHQNLRKMVNLTASYLIWFFFSVRFSCYFKKLFWHYWLVGWLVGWQIFFFNILFFLLWIMDKSSIKSNRWRWWWWWTTTNCLFVVDMVCVCLCVWSVWK